MNNKSFEHDSYNGTRFKATRCDFREGVDVVMVSGTTREELMADVAEMIGYHARNIWPELNGFQGYDVITFRVREV